LPRPLLAPAVWTAIAASVAFRLLAPGLGVGAVGAEYLTPACLDRLGAGALLALAERGGRFPAWLPRAGLAAAAAFAAAWLLPYSPPLYLLQQVAMTLALAALVAGAATGIGGPAGALLAARPVRAVGRISYAAYLF